MSKPSAEFNLASFGSHAATIQAIMADLVKQQALQRVFDKNLSLWNWPEKPIENPAECVEWTDIFKRTVDTLQHSPCKNRVVEIQQNFDTVVLVGIGGAVQSAEVFASMAREPACQLKIISSTSPAIVSQCLELAESNSVHFIISSKSGETLETFDIACTLLAAVAKVRDDVARYFTVLTEPGPSRLRKWADKNHLPVLDADPKVPGRFSALGMMGLFPAAIIGFNLDELLEVASKQVGQYRVNSAESARENCRLGAVLAMLCKCEGARLNIKTSRQQRALAKWIEQLVAESLGKEGMGVLPVIEVEEAEVDELVMSACPSQAEIVEIYHQQLPRFHSAIEIVIEWQVAVVLAAWWLKINPANQPDVVRVKQYTRNKLDQLPTAPVAMIEDEFCSVAHEDAIEELLFTMLSSVRDSDYICILAYVSPSTDNENLVEQLAQELKYASGATVVFNFGPQYLHSTGQFHKGGPANGHYLIIKEDCNDLKVYGKPYSFNDSISVQAIADLVALRELGRPVYAVNAGIDLQYTVRLFYRISRRIRKGD